MSAFPRTSIGSLSVSRMVIGTNWFLGYSHRGKAQDQYIRQVHSDYRSIAGVLEVFVRAGVDTVMYPPEAALMADACREAEQRTGRPMIRIATPSLPTTRRTALEGFDEGKVAAILDRLAAAGVAVCMPHTSTTDQMVDKCSREVRRMDLVCRLIRERNMVPGLSTHLPETIVYSDETGLDVETYICILNAAGFLMPVEVDWTVSLIHRAKKPVLTIKPMAAGRSAPLEAMTFVWNAIRPQDMVTVGTLSAGEASGLIEISLRVLAGEAGIRGDSLQASRSKATLLPSET